MFIAIVMCEPPAINPEDRSLENESEGFSLMILTSVNAMQLSRCPAPRRGRAPSGEVPGDRMLRDEGGESKRFVHCSPHEANPNSTSGARELTLGRASGR